MIQHMLISILLVSTLRHVLSEACPGIEMVDRISWGARIPYAEPSLSTPTYHVFIAHTVTPECWGEEDCSIRMRSMQNYHMNNLGFYDIGYNFVIGGNGRVFVGTGWFTQGTHTKGFNSKSLGIAFVGDFTRRVPNIRMMNAARQLIICGIQRGFIAKEREIHGARDGTCTASPGDALYEQIKKWPGFKGGMLPGYTC